MKPNRCAKGIVWSRRLIQVGSLVLFLALLLLAHYREGVPASAWTGLFFDIDPLILLATWISARNPSELSFLALITVLITVIMGRVFCGWVCPLGTLHNAISWLRSKKRSFRSRTGEFSPWQRAKYLILIMLLVITLFGANWIGVFDPISLLTRSMSTAVLPAVHYTVDASSTAVYNADPHLGPLHLTSLTEPVYHFFRDKVFFGRRPVFSGGALVLMIFIGALVLNLVRPRFWCRYICPTGALLGALSKRSGMRLVSQSKCRHCGLCQQVCPSAAQPQKPGEWLPTECYQCWNCVAACPHESIDFSFEFPFTPLTGSKVDLGKRQSIGALLGGLGGLMLMRITPLSRGTTFNPELIRPPGALPEPEFLARCIQCGLCMQACPTGMINPTFDEAGLEGLWTPVLIPQIGYCEWECNLCGEVCPTGAIEPLPLPEKQKVKMGLATFDTDRCLPYAYERQCIVCEEHCPIPDKAIFFDEKEILCRDGVSRVFKLPKVDPEKCTGCGICETMCVFRDQAAIRITSAGESRHPDNQPILPGSSTFDYRAIDSAEPDIEDQGNGESDPYGY
jgi:MauM/NapG family ferredoxin protein